MLVLLILCAVLAGFLVLPFLLIGLVLRLAIGLALLPLRLVGLVIRLSLGLAFGVLALVLAGALFLIPLLPVIALAGIVWLLYRLVRGRPIGIAHPV